MSAVWFRSRSDRRRSWRAWVGLGLLVGLIGGAVLAAAAGARRTDSAYRRFSEATKAADAFVFSSAADPTFAHISADQLTQLPEVASVAELSFYGIERRGPDSADLSLEAGPDERFGGTVQRHQLLSGRQPRPDAVDEALVSFTLASLHNVKVGGTVTLSLTAAGEDNPPPVAATFRVVGIEATAGEFPPQRGTGTTLVVATPAFYRAYAARLAAEPAIAMRLHRGGKDVATLQEGIKRLADGKPVQFYPVSAQSVNVQRSLHLQALALWLLAGLLAFEGVLVIAQLLIRQAQLESAEHPALRALGMSRGQLWTIGLARAVFIGGLGAAAAVVMAALLSPLAPVGLARVAEPHPGFALDLLVLMTGALGTVVLVLAAAAGPSWRTAAAPFSRSRTATAGQNRPSALAGTFSRTAAPIPVAAGVRLALEPGRGRTAVPVRSTIAGAVIGIVALAAALTFGASLSHLLATPRLYGVNWDAEVVHDGEQVGEGAGTAVGAVAQDPDVADVSAGYVGVPIALGAVHADAVAVSPEQGASLQPVPIEGRLPSEPDEVMLGTRTMAALHAHVGSTVEAIAADATPDPLPLQVVGRAVFPTLSDGLGLGRGVALTPDGVRRLIPSGAPAPDTILVRFHHGVNRARARARLQERVGPLGEFTVLAPERPDDLVNFGRVQSLPLVLGILLGAFAAATLAHLLVTSIRRRRPDLAVLKVLGLTSAQVRATVAWQATTLAVVAAAVGVPLGVAAGRLVWRLFAEQLGTTAEPAVPLVALGALSAAALAVANLVAVLPARSAARTQPAVALRSE